MKLNNLKLTNFRNYSNLEINFPANLNFIYGNNGSGKTNLVEAIYILSLTKSFRINNDKYLIKKGEEKAQIDGEILNRKLVTSYKVIINKDGKKVLIDHNKVDKISEYVSRIAIVLFNPRDIELINAAPNERRKLINIEISQLYREYLIILSNYNKILKQRNAYLKQMYLNGNERNEYLDILTSKLVSLGKSIYKYRKDYIENINKYVGDIYEKIFMSGKLKIRYISAFSKTEEEIFDNFKKLYVKELEFGKTLMGIHHDDIEFLLDSNKLKEFGSEGQLKNAILSFKLAEIELIKEKKDDYPILILDDLFSELDSLKIINILNMLNNEVQTFITLTNIELVPKEILKISKIYEVISSEIKERN